MNRKKQNPEPRLEAKTSKRVTGPQRSHKAIPKFSVEDLQDMERGRLALLQMHEAEEERWRALQRYTFEAIGEARRRDDPEANHFLELVRRELAPITKTRGPKRKAATHRDRLNDLLKLSQGKTLKEIEPNEKTRRALYVEIQRFVKLVCGMVRSKTSGAVKPDSLIPETPFTNARLKILFHDLPGIQFPGDIPALRKAFQLASQNPV